MKMIDLKRVDKKPEQESTALTSDWPQDEYPVTIWLENDQLDQLGVKNMDVGDEMIIMAKVKVKSFAASETNKGSQKSGSLTVMSMAISPAMAEKSAAQALYGGKDAE